ncbi:MAG TPA: phosphoribosylformylglycinamidine synthase subunit PurL, partial [Candidatus Dormibacteraeota bacterium]|nr:phosphoribosylformylglycinamidine synthase subunit PurL [Candidatus Dormibacteraeota bacterium]
NRLELSMLGALWSEHCSYKTSRALLRTLPTTGPAVLQGPGENAGVVDLGQGLACCFKIESHNHPSVVEPVQGAATGVGGILRDIFAMGARPVAILDAIRFGDPQDRRQRHRFQRVVEGIGWYGNCIGVPTVGGETVFDAGYAQNCIVDAMCVGLVEPAQLLRARAQGVGNPVLLVGADTGRDGIHGATFASAQFDADAAARRPAVQVGNPFLEKCLLEACQELLGHPAVVALQDCGAAGLTSSCAEMAHRGGVGMELDVARVRRREQGMTPEEVMLSESQERMVLVLEAGGEAAVEAVFHRWGLHGDVIGRVIAAPRLRILDGPEPVADLDLAVLVDGSPERHPPAAPPPDLAARLAEDPLAGAPDWSPLEAWRRLLASPNCGEARRIWRQYDHMVGNDTLAGPGGDAAVLRLRGRPDALALTVDGGHRSGSLDPRRGAAIAVAEAARNLSCVGAVPLGLTNCLNLGDPDRPEGMWQLTEVVAGVGDAARALGIPVVSGNVSLYNDTLGQSIPPTPVVGMVGRLPEAGRRVGAGFVAAGDRIALLGPPGAELGGSELQRLARETVAGPAPALDLELEGRVQVLVREAIAQGLLRSAHDCALGGLAMTLAEACLLGGLGATITLPGLTGADPREQLGQLFGETQSRLLVSCTPAAAAALERLWAQGPVPGRWVGRVGGTVIAIGDVAEIALAEAHTLWAGALAG